MNRIVHHGRSTAYRQRGSGASSILFVHGSGASSALWTRQLRLGKTRERTVAALDLSGHGESDDVDAEPGYETLSAYAADVVAVATEIDADVLVGHSLGGAVAMSVAIDRDVQLNGLVLAGTGARLAVLEDLRTWLWSDFERAIDFLHRPDVLFHDPDDEMEAASRAALRETGQEVTRRDFLTAHAFDVRGRLGAIDAPSLVVAGEYDRLTPPRYHDYLVEHIPEAERATIDDAAHLAMLERPDAFNEVLEKFLDE